MTLVPPLIRSGVLVQMARRRRNTIWRLWIVGGSAIVLWKVVEWVVG